MIGVMLNLATRQMRETRPIYGRCCASSDCILWTTFRSSNFFTIRGNVCPHERKTFNNNTLAKLAVPFS